MFDLGSVFWLVVLYSLAGAFLYNFFLKPALALFLQRQIEKESSLGSFVLFSAGSVLLSGPLVWGMAIRRTAIALDEKNESST